jgi:hypothetical protein
METAGKAEQSTGQRKFADVQQFLVRRMASLLARDDLDVAEHRPNQRVLGPFRSIAGLDQLAFPHHGDPVA